MRRLLAALFGLTALFAGTAASRPGAWEWTLPPGIDAPTVPADNPMNHAKVELGRRLFYDADLSIDGTMSCATCHSQRRAFADSTRTRPGVHGDPGRRNVQGLANVAYLTPLTWADSRLATLEAQVAVPVFGDRPVEMGMKGQEVELLRRLSGDKCYRRMFREAFPDTRGTIDTVAIAKALAAFQRTLISYGSPYDRYRRGEGMPLSGPAKQGEALFQQHCASCHAGANFTDAQFHAIEDGQDGTDPGLADVTGRSEDHGKFRTPSLRNVTLTGPYWHDGSAGSISEAIERHGEAVPAVSHLSENQREAILAFLASLSDDSFTTSPRFAHPDRACGKLL